jgi:hypothetical protein
MAQPSVGIFFLVGDTWLIDAVPVADGEPYGDAVEHGGHYDLWEAMKPRTPAERRFAAHDYDYFPRGRVVYFPTTKTYRVYVDNCLTSAQRAELLVEFALAGESAMFEGNDDGTHYVCATCSRNYLE